MTATVFDDKIIGVISDTHGSLPAWRKALSLFGPDIKTILHAGDVLYHGPRNALPCGYTPSDLANAINDFCFDGGNVIVSQGNCDAPVDIMILEPEVRYQVFIEWRGKKIFMMHGDNYELLRHNAFARSVDVAVFGHTHVASLSREDGVIFLNPGSATIPKGKYPASAAVLSDEGITVTTLDGKVLNFERW